MRTFGAGATYPFPAPYGADLSRKGRGGALCGAITTKAMSVRL